MARGILAGVATGLVISVGAAVGLSLVMGYPPPPSGLLPEPEVSDAALPEATAPETPEAQAAPPAADTAPAPGAPAGEAGLAAPAPDAALPEATDTEPAAMPEVEGEGAQMEAPEPGGAVDGIAVSPDAPVIETPESASPSAPDTEARLSISTDPAQPPMPDMSGDAPVAAPGAPEAAPDAAPASEPTPAAPAAPQSAETTPAVPLPPDAGAAMTPPAAMPEADGPAIGQSAGALTDREDPARSTRLPTIGADEDPSGAAPDARDPQAAPPIRRFAASVDAAPDTPRMAIVLIDDGAGPLGPAALDAFPFPVSFAVDPAAPDAAERMAGYRAKGFEVLALVDAPEGAQASDIEVIFEVALSTLPEVVGVLEAPGGGLQGSRGTAEQVAAYLLASGHGLVMQGQGLNTATSLAQREGVPAGAVFRDIDGEGQDPGTQRRMLDRVALRARQDGSVIALGRLKADTVSALLLWGLQDRANALALVPVSGVIAPE